MSTPITGAALAAFCCLVALAWIVAEPVLRRRFMMTSVTLKTLDFTFSAKMLLADLERLNAQIRQL